jgi:hypothetical protein
MKYIFNFGGGVNSTAMYFLIREKNLHLDEIVFADTGAELPMTYDTLTAFLNIAEKDSVKMTVIKSNLGDIYSYYHKHKTVPSRMRRDCTSKFKISPIRNYLRTKYGKKEHFTHYLGIAYDEAHRMRTSDVSYATNAYPLVDNRITRKGCLTILKEHGFNNVVKSGCFFCPFTKKEGWIDLLDKYPELFNKAISLEENCPNPKTTLTSQRLSIVKAKISDFRKGQSKLEDFEPTCDIAGSCFL